MRKLGPNLSPQLKGSFQNKSHFALPCIRASLHWLHNALGIKTSSRLLGDQTGTSHFVPAPWFSPHTANHLSPWHRQVKELLPDTFSLSPLPHAHIPLPDLTPAPSADRSFLKEASSDASATP